MDYEGIVNILRSYRFMTLNRSMIDDALTDAADAIEALLAERDAAEKALKKFGCNACKHSGVSRRDNPCCDCCRLAGWEDKWEWRGPQEESDRDGQA